MALDIHHTRKSAVGQRADSSQAMGSHTFAMMTDGNLQLKRSDTEPDKRVLFETGSRDFSGFRPRLLKLNEMNLWFRDLGECNEEDHTQEINKVKRNIMDYPVTILKGIPGNQLTKDSLLGKIMSQYRVSQVTAYRSFEKAAKNGRLAESSQHVVTLVKTFEQTETASTDFPGVDAELPEVDDDGHSQVEN